MPAIKIRHFVWEDSMVTSQRSWLVNRRTILKTSAAIAAVQFTSPYILKARGDTPLIPLDARGRFGEGVDL